MAKFDIHNPGRATRVIYDASMNAVTIARGATRRDIDLSDEIAKELQGRAKNANELQIKPTGEEGGERVSIHEEKPEDKKSAEGDNEQENRPQIDKTLARQLIDNAEDMDFNEFKNSAKDLLGDDWPGGNPSRAVIVQSLEQIA